MGSIVSTEGPGVDSSTHANCSRANPSIGTVHAQWLADFCWGHLRPSTCPMIWLL